MMPTDQLTWPRITTLLLVCYWVALATATHVPKLPTVALGTGDKTAHFVAYAALALALSVAWHARWPWAGRAPLWVWLLASAYGAVDELTQIPVPGRYGEWRDWLADLLGAMIGVMTFTLFHTVRNVWRASKDPQ